MSDQLVIVRHGETEWSAAGRHTSVTDLSLVNSGRERAAALGGALGDRSFEVVLCSPLRRARETCELAGFASGVLIDEDLREWGYGDYEGLTTPQIREERPDWSLWSDGCPGGESPAEVAVRADRVLSRMREVGGGALAFAHGHILRVLAARWIELGPEGGSRLLLGAGSFSLLGYERGTAVLAGWNLSPD